MKVLVLNPPSKSASNAVRDLQYGCWCKGKRIGGTTVPPLTLLYVASVLKQAGHDVALLEALAQKVSFERVKEIIRGYDMVITLTATMAFKEDAAILGEFKKINENLKTVIFGSHPTFMPKYALKKGCIDIIVRYEPEFAMRDLANALESGGDLWKKTKGIGFLEGDEMVLNEPYPFIKDLDELPFPDRTLLPKGANYFNPLVKRSPYTSAITSRGCPARCAFCVVPPFYGTQLRCRSAENVLQEFELIKFQGFKEIFIRDETFTAYQQRNAEICEGMIKRRLNLTWVCNTRVNAVNEEMLRLMKAAGCHMIKFGVESGVQKILDNLNKNITVEATQKAFALARKTGIDTHAHLMIGSPGETLETINQSIEFIRRIRPTTITVGICSPYPGTPLFERVQKTYPQIGDASDNDFSRLHEKGFYNQAYCDIEPKCLEANLKRFYRKFYMRPSYVLGWLGRIRSLDELKRVAKAGLNLMQFSVEGDGI
jgi:radical SAM superfamily enzyme YgiQ (UPF0313 family)